MVWLSRAPDWEPLITFFTLLFGYAFQEYKDYQKYLSKDNTKEHDKSLFLQYEELLPEDDLNYVLNNNLYNNWMQYRFSKQIGSYVYLAKGIKGRFLNKKLQPKFEIFVKRLDELKSFMGTHFFVNDGGSSPDDWIVSLYPDLKKSGDEQKRKLYQKREKELHEIIDRVEDAYNIFRVAVKERLCV